RIGQCYSSRARQSHRTRKHQHLSELRVLSRSRLAHGARGALAEERPRFVRSVKGTRGTRVPRTAGSHHHRTGGETMNEPRPGNGHTCEVDGCFALAARVTDQWFQIPNDPVRCHVLCGAHWEDLLDKLEKSARRACTVDDH